MPSYFSSNVPSGNRRSTECRPPRPRPPPSCHPLWASLSVSRRSVLHASSHISPNSKLSQPWICLTLSPLGQSLATTDDEEESQASRPSWLPPPGAVQRPSHPFLDLSTLSSRSTIVCSSCIGVVSFQVSPGADTRRFAGSGMRQNSSSPPLCLSRPLPLFGQPPPPSLPPLRPPHR